MTKERVLLRHGHHHVLTKQAHKQNRAHVNNMNSSIQECTSLLVSFLDEYQEMGFGKHATRTAVLITPDVMKLTQFHKGNIRSLVFGGIKGEVTDQNLET